MKNVLLLPVILFSGVLGHPEPRIVAASSEPVSQHGCAVAADEKGLRQIALQWKDSYNSGDAAKVAALYAPDAYYMTQHYISGVIHPRANIQAYVQRGVDAKYRVDKIEILALGCSRDLGYVVGRYESTNAGEKAFGAILVVSKKIGGRWLIVAHETTVPDLATAIQRLDRAGSN